MSAPALHPALPSPDDSPLVFLHVPKTAGTTLWLILRRQYSPAAVVRADGPAALAALPDAQRDGARVLLGHLPYGVHPFPRPPTCVTVLRDPLERTLSHYGHWLRSADRPAPLADWLDAGDPTIDNLQTRMLAGPEAVTLPFGQCDRAVFERAARNLTEGVALAGLTERFDETLLLLQRLLGWGLPCYVPENVGANRVRSADLPPALRQRIHDMTRWDRALYALAAGRFDERIAQEGPRFADSLRRFRVANARYRRARALSGAGPLHAFKSLLSLDRQMGLESAVRTALAMTLWYSGQ